MTTEQQLKALYEKQIHIGFIRSEQNNEILASEVCSEESLRLVLHQDHPCHIARNFTSINKGRTIYYVSTSFRTQFYDLIISYFGDHGVSLNVIQEAVQMQTIVNLVATGMGISVVPSSVESYQRPGVIYKKSKRLHQQ